MHTYVYIIKYISIYIYVYVNFDWLLNQPIMPLGVAITATLAQHVIDVIWAHYDKQLGFQPRIEANHLGPLESLTVVGIC